MELTLDDKLDFLLALLVRGMAPNVAARIVQQTDEEGTLSFTYDESRYEIVKEFDTAGYPFYTVTIGG